MTREKLFEFAKERGWDKILEAAYETHSLTKLAALFSKKESHLRVELREMQALGLLALIGKVGGYRYAPTVWGIKFLQEESEKAGKTYSCLLCGTTTGLPHVCPIFNPEMRQ